MSNPVISNMLSRANHCRQLAVSITDAQAASALLDMAQEVEADAKRLEEHDVSGGVTRLDPAPHDHVPPDRPIHIEVACTPCGSDRFLCLGGDDDDAEVVCAKCGFLAGTMGSVKQVVATVIVERETIARRSGSQTHEFDDEPTLRTLP